MQNRILVTPLLAALAFGPAAAHADDGSKSMFTFSGFGTVGVSHSSQRMGDYVIDSTVPKGAGRSHAWDWGNDTRLGAQLSAEFSPSVTAVVQVISEYQYDSTYRPTIEWANVKYAFNPNFYVRAGRIALPTFLNSDTRKVGYSYPWIHPPAELYRQLAITNSDGVDAMYRTSFGEAGNALRIISGQSKLERATSTSTARGLWGVFDTVEYGAALFRIGYQERESSSANRVTGVTGPWVWYSDLSVGASYDPGNWFVMAEWIQRKSTQKKDAMYVSGGYRIDRLTPYATYSRASASSFLPTATMPTAAAIQFSRRSESTVSLGTRWDFMKNTDFKVQYDQVRLSADSNGDLANVPAGVKLYGARFHVVSFVVDFVF